jgi:hypothetical protein
MPCIDFPVTPSPRTKIHLHVLAIRVGHGFFAGFVYFGRSPSLCDRNEPLNMKNGEELTELYLHQFSTDLDAYWLV